MLFSRCGEGGRNVRAQMRRGQIRVNRRYVMADIAHIGAAGSRVGWVIARDEHAAERFGISLEGMAQRHVVDHVEEVRL